MHNAILELSEFATVPTTGSTYKVSGDSLELVDMLASAVRTFLKSFVCILEATVHATVAVVVD